MTDQDPFACTLTPDEQVRREPADQALAGQLSRWRWDRDRGVVLTFPSEAEALVHEFVRNESACCAFFHFDVQPGPAAVRLTVSAPEGGERMLAALVDAFTTGVR